jgi:hypothetical protein
MDVDDKYLDMHVFRKHMEGKHTEIVRNNDDDSMSINSTNIFFILDRIIPLTNIAKIIIIIISIMKLITHLVKELK